MKKDTKSVLPAVQDLLSWKLKHLNSCFSICRNSLASATSHWSSSLMLSNLPPPHGARDMFSLICKEEQKHGGIEAAAELRDGSAEQSWIPDRTQVQYSSILARASTFPSSGREERGNDTRLSLIPTRSQDAAIVSTAFTQSLAVSLSSTH